MEARTILLTSLVFALWTSTTTGQEFCVGKVDGPYCEHCWQPVDCTAEVVTADTPCNVGTACTVAFGDSYCAPHTQTECACAGTSPQCDAYNPEYIVYCDASGPFLVDSCPSTAPTCNNDECVVSPSCNPDSWNLTPDCTGAYYCDENGIIIAEVYCEGEEYVNSEFECAPAPPPACDGSCSGRCPNPVDCTKYFVCDGTTVVSSGSCPPNSYFDIVSNTCLNDGYICTFLDGCDFVGTTTTSGEITTSWDETATTSDGITSTWSITTTEGSGFPSSPDETCNSSTVGSKYPYDFCSQLYWLCKEQVNGQYEYVVNYCPGDFYFDTDASNPYCTDSAEIATCQ